MKRLVILLAILMVTPVFIPASFNTSLQMDTTTYDSFGMIVKNLPDTVTYFFRQGTSHVGDKGKIVGQSYNLDTETWGERFTVYEDPNQLQY